MIKLMKLLNNILKQLIKKMDKNFKSLLTFLLINIGAGYQAQRCFPSDRIKLFYKIYD